MSEKVFVVFATVTLPKGDDDVVVVEGRYIIDGGAVVLTDRNGKPVVDQLGRTYRHKLKDGDDSAHQWAQRLTKQLRLSLLGKDPTRPATKLVYPKIGYA